MYVVFNTIWHERGGIGGWKKNKGMEAVRNDIDMEEHWQLKWPNRSKMMIDDEDSYSEFFS